MCNVFRIALRASLVCFLIAISCTSTLAQSSIIFAGIPWGAGKADTKQKLAAAGFKFDEEDKDGDLRFSGAMPLVGERAIIFVLFTADNKLVKVAIKIIPPDHRTLDTYHSVKASVTEKYGRPKQEMEHYKYPYDDVGGAVGHEVTAISNGKAVIVSLWGDTTGGDGLTLSVTDRLIVELTYESSQWGVEVQRRKAKVNVF